MDEARAASGDLAARLATDADLPALAALMHRAIAENLKPFLNLAQIEASYAIMGLDTALIADRTYFVVEAGGQLAGCGGWSRAPPSTAATTRADATQRGSIRRPTRRASAPCTPTRRMSAAASAA